MEIEKIESKINNLPPKIQKQAITPIVSEAN